MRKLNIILAVFIGLFFIPLTLQAQQWMSGFLRDNTGAIYIDCKTSSSADQATGPHGIKRDSSGYVDVAGCTGHTAIPSATPGVTPTPLAVAYNPSYIYAGSGGGGGGGDDCGASTPCLTGSGLQQINVQYIEGLSGTTSTYSGVKLCAPSGTYFCSPVWYNKIDDMQCSAGLYDATTYNTLDAHDTSGSDPGFLHLSTPSPGATPPVWALHRTGQADGVGASATCANNTKGTYADPASTGGYLTTAVNGWFTGASWVNGNTNVCTRWDNESLVYSTQEYGLINSVATAKSALQGWTINTGSFFAQFPYCQIFNNVGHGGTAYTWNYNFASGSPANVAFACFYGLGSCNDIDDWCNAGTVNFKAFQYERPLTASPYDGALRWENNLPAVLDTLSHIYTSPNLNPCSTVQPIMLDATWSNNSGSAGNSADDRYFRDQSLALRLLALRGGYNQTQAGVIEQRYANCPSLCTSQVTVMPEDAIVAFPLDSGMTRYTNTSNTGDGNGCNSGDNGGIKTFLIRCIGTDDNGDVGAIYSRAFRVWIDGTYYGIGVLIANQTNQKQSILDTDCQIDGLTTPCSAYPKYWHYGGVGAQTCYEDQGTGLGSANATCSGTQICPATFGGATNCQGYAAEANTTTPFPGMTTPMQLGICPDPLDIISGWPTAVSGTTTYALAAEDCSALLLYPGKV